MSEKCLEVASILKRFGGLTALNGISMHIDESEIVGLIGPNGSGKTTLFNCITGLLKPDNGKIFLRGDNITAKSPHEVIQKGISRTFQITRVFPELTVMENMLMSISHKKESRINPLYQKSSNEEIKRASELLEFVGIMKLAYEFGGELSYGQQKLLELASALMQNPSVVLLDEPTAGVNPTLINKITERILGANEEFGVTFLVIEHNMDVIMEISQRMYALSSGEVIAEGDPEKVRDNPEVFEAYLGGD
jgi:branched-chain amino acid transport system ATP-binding protein